MLQYPLQRFRNKKTVIPFADFLKLNEECRFPFWNDKIPKDVLTPKSLVLPWNNTIDPEKGDDCVDTYIKDHLEEIINKIGFPLFVRTDLLSAKHSFKFTCFVENESNLYSCISTLIDTHRMCLEYLPIKHLVFREFIPLHSKFKAFIGEMPVATEIRFFALDGVITCGHWYWIKDAIEMPRSDDWENGLAFMEETAKRELCFVLKLAKTVVKNFDNFWSLDFARSEDGKWYLIDMARGELSYHHNCINSLLKGKDQELIIKYEENEFWETYKKLQPELEGQQYYDLVDGRLYLNEDHFDKLKEILLEKNTLNSFKPVTLYIDELLGESVLYSYYNQETITATVTIGKMMFVFTFTEKYSENSKTTKLFYYIRIEKHHEGRGSTYIILNGASSNGIEALKTEISKKWADNYERIKNSEASLIQP